MQFRDNCNHCNEDYEFSDGTDHLAVYDGSPQYTHIYAMCPNCQNECRIFIGSDLLEAMEKAATIPVYHYDTVPDEISAMYDELSAETPPEPADSLYHEGGTSYDLPEPARDVLMELWNWMRHFGGECGTKCLFPECGQF